MKSTKPYNKLIRNKVLDSLAGGESVASVSGRKNISKSTIYRWRYQAAQSVLARSAVMRAVKKSGTSLEKRFAKLLAESGLDEFEEQAVDLAGTPDFVNRAKRIVIFVDSCFWHGCSLHHRKPKSNLQYWLGKIAGNKQRDLQQTRELKRLGWVVVRIWEHEFVKPHSIHAKLKRLVTRRSS